MEKLGIDIGGVIIARGKEAETDTSFFSDNYLDTPEVVGAFETIKLLSKSYYGDQIYLVSKAGELTKQRTKDWLVANCFSQMTGLSLLDHLFFCANRRDKVSIAMHLGLTRFIDDRLEVLSHMARIIPHLFLLNRELKEVAKCKQYLRYVNPVFSWQEIVDWHRFDLF